MTIVDTVVARFAGDKVKMAFAFAKLLNQEALALQADGVDITQFDEPAFNVHMKDAANRGLQALERAARGLTCTTAVHTCYGYGIKANARVFTHAGLTIPPVSNGHGQCFFIS